MALPLSIIGIILANLWVAAGILLFGWDSWSVVYMYWWESAIIGFFTILKILLAKSDGNAMWGATANKVFLTGFFCVHFGGFMLVHLALLSVASMVFFSISQQAPATFQWTTLTGLLALFLSHGFSFVSNYWLGEEYKTTQAGRVMLAPYPRVVLMQLVAVLGLPFMMFIPGIAGLLLVIGKTVFDVVGHLAERWWLKSSSSPVRS